MLISVVFSFRNEAPILEELIARVSKAFARMGADYELIFVNDDSVDGSLGVLLGQREKNGRIKVINMSRRFGVYPCVLAGFRHAKGDAVIYMDSDLQDPPELIPALVDKWKEGADVVNTQRTKRHGENPVKMWITRQAYKVINMLSDIEMPVNMGDFKLYSRRALNELLKLDEYEPYVRGLARWIGFRQETVKYEREPRFSGDTHVPLFGRGPITEFVKGITSFSSIPLYLSIAIGLVVLFSSFVYAGIAVLLQLYGNPAWSATLFVTLLVGGLVLLSNGIMGLYVARIHKEAMNRSLYIIKEKIGFDGPA